MNDAVPSVVGAAPSAARRLVIAAIFVGVGLRTWEAAESSLWLDEMHSLHHSQRATLAEVCDSVDKDFHAPLFFASLFWARPVLGGWEHAHLLRLLPILGNLLLLWPLLRMARGTAASGVAAFLFACLPYQIVYGTELRPYAWLGLASAWAFHEAFSTGGSHARRFLSFAAATAFGVWTQFLMIVPVLAIGAARLIDAALERFGPRRDPAAPKPLPLAALVFAGALGGGSLMPWILAYDRWMFESPQEFVPTEESAAKLSSKELLDIAQAPLKLITPSVDALGAPWSALAIAGGAVFGLAVVIAGVAWAASRQRRRSAPAGRALRGAVVFAVVAFAATAILSARGWGRVAMRYFVTLAWAIPLVIAYLIGSLESAALRRVVAAAALAGALAMGVAQAGGGGREQTRPAVEQARAAGAALAAADPAHPPLYTSLLWQPRFFEFTLPYRTYAPDLSAREPSELPSPGAPGFDQPVVVITQRYYDLDKLDVVKHPDEPVLAIRRGRRCASKTKIDTSYTVWVFVPE